MKESDQDTVLNDIFLELLRVSLPSPRKIEHALPASFYVAANDEECSGGSYA